MSVPSIQIRQTHAKIGIETTQGQLEIRQPRPDLELEQVPTKLEMRQPNGELKIDQSRAWDALGRTPILEVMNRIYGQARNIAMDGIARIVEDGNKLAAIHEETNAIADLAQRTTVSFPEMQYAGQASGLNVDIDYTVHKPEINAIQGKVKINSRVNKPQINFHHGNVRIYMRQYPKVEFIPPQIDRTI